MKILNYQLGPLKANAYILINELTRDAIAIDIGGDEKYLFLESIKNDFNIKYVLLTHGHFDHIGGVKFFQSKGAKVYIGSLDKDMLNNSYLNFGETFGIEVEPFYADELIYDNDKLNLCGINIEAFSVPGHSKGGMVYKIENYLFTGDTIMKDSYGRYDGPGGNENELYKSLKKILSMDENLIIYPGHGESSKIKEEKINYAFN